MWYLGLFGCDNLFYRETMWFGGFGFFLRFQRKKSSGGFFQFFYAISGFPFYLQSSIASFPFPVFNVQWSMFIFQFIISDFQFSITNLKFTIPNFQCTRSNLQLPVSIFQFTNYNFQFAISKS